MKSGLFSNNPYVGPRSFHQGERLYGRDREVIDLVDLLIAERIVLLYSPSGAGKTSLVQAALIPALEREEFLVLPPMRVSMDVASRDVKLGDTNRYLLSLMLTLDEGRPVAEQRRLADLLHVSLEEYLQSLEAAADVRDGTVLIFDQFEEILTINPTDRQQKIAFFEEVGRILSNRNRWALFSMREDFIAALDPFVRYLPTQLRNTYRLELLSPENAYQAIQAPAESVGIAFDRRAADKLINDLRMVRVPRSDGTVDRVPGLYVEPVQLQVVCHRIWNTGAAEDGVIDEEDLKEVKDVSTALAGYYAERVAFIAEEYDTAEEKIRRFFDRELITEQGIRGQVLQGPSASGGLENRLIAALMDAYLVRAEKRRGVTWLELAHDRLIEPIQKNNAEWYLPNQSTVQRQAALWAERDRDESLLISDDEALETAYAWAEENQTNDVEKAYLARSRVVLEARGRRERRRLTRIALFTTLLAVVAMIGYVYAATQRSAAKANESAAIGAQGTAEAESTRAFDSAQAEATSAAAAEQARVVEAAARATAESAGAAAQEANANLEIALAEAEQSEADAQAAAAAERALRLDLALAKQEAEAQALAAEANFSQLLAAQSINRSSVELDLSLLLAVEAYGQADTPLAREAILAALQNSVLATIQVERLLDERSSDYATAFSPDGTLIAAAGFGPQPAIWDAASGEELLRLPIVSGINPPFLEVLFSPDGTRLVTASQDGLIAIWDTRTGGLVRRLTYEVDNFAALAISPDGRLLATGGDSTTVLLWDIEKGEVGRFVTNQATVYSIAFSADGQFLATAGAPQSGGSERVTLWNVSSGQRVDTSVVKEAPDASQENAAETSAAAGAEALFAPFSGHTDDVHRVLFTPDGTSLIAADDRGLILVWSAATGRETLRISGAHSGRVRALAVSPSGRTMVSGGVDGRVVLWDLASGDQIGQGVRAHSAEVTSLAFGPEGSRLVSTSLDLNTALLLWNVVASRQVIGSTFAGYGGPVNVAAFSEDDRLLATGSCADPGCATGRLRLLDTATLSATMTVDYAGAGPSQVSLLSAADLLAVRVGSDTLQIFNTSVPTPTHVFTTAYGVSLSLARLVQTPAGAVLLLLVDGQAYIADAARLPDTFRRTAGRRQPAGGCRARRPGGQRRRHAAPRLRRRRRPLRSGDGRRHPLGRRSRGKRGRLQPQRRRAGNRLA